MNNSILKILSAVLMVAGLWLIIAPLFFSEFGRSSAAYWSSIIAGILIILAAGVREWVSQGDTRWASWVNVVLGIWLIASPFVLGFASLIMVLWSTLIVGILVLIVAAGSVTGSHTTPANPTLRHPI